MPTMELRKDSLKQPLKIFIKKMKIIALIPARLAATRFPNKPLAKIMGLPMIEHVRRRVALCPLLNEVIVATCDEEIRKMVEASGGKVAMTSDKHVRCTDRIAEAASHLQADIFINVQGDEPLIQPQMIEEVAKPLLEDSSLQTSNLMCAISDDQEFQSPNAVKVVTDSSLNLLYASREPIPSPLKADDKNYPKWKQLGIIAFRSGFLQTFSRLSPTPLEKIESIDMLRALEHGYRVRMVPTKGRLVGVDVPEQIGEVEKLLENDPLTGEYL